MTIGTNYAPSSGNWTGVETSYGTGIYVDDSDHLIVKFTPTGGSQITLVKNVNYSVVLSDGIATVTPLVIPYAAGVFSFSRKTPDAQQIAFTPGGSVKNDTNGQLHDLAVLRDQELRQLSVSNEGRLDNAESRLDTLEDAEDDLLSARDTAVANAGYAKEWATSPTPPSAAAGNTGGLLSSKAYAEYLGSIALGVLDPWFLTFAAMTAYDPASDPAPVLRTHGGLNAFDGGGGVYRYRSDLSAAFAAANPRWSFATATNEYVYVLVPEGAGYAKIRQFLPFGTGSSSEADDDAVAAAIAMCAYYANARTTLLYYPCDLPLRFDVINLYLTATLDFKRRVDWRAAGAGNLGGWGGPTQLIFAPDVGGMRVHNAYTEGDAVGSISTGADMSYFEGFFLDGAGTDRDAHGIWMRGQSVFVDCCAFDFPGDGFRVWGTGGATGTDGGSPNLSKLDRCFAVQCGGWGYICEGADANVIQTDGFSAILCGKGGMFDSAFLGNQHNSPHTRGNALATAGNGGNTNVGSSVVHYSGKHYEVVRSQAAAAKTTVPGTDPAVWFDRGAGSSHPYYPDWTSGMDVIDGRSFAVEGGGNRTALIIPYAEGDQARAYGELACVAIGGIADWDGAVQFLRGSDDGALWKNGVGAENVASDGVVVKARVGGDANLKTFALWSTSAMSFPMRWRLSAAGDLELISATTDSTRGLLYTGGDTTTDFGRGVAKPYAVGLPALALGAGEDTSVVNMRIVGVSAGPPAGLRAKGELYFERDAAAGKPVAYRAITTGNPPTWEYIAGPAVHSTTAALQDIADAINTTDKFTDKPVVDDTTGIRYWASGGTAGSVWRGADGSTLTPS